MKMCERLPFEQFAARYCELQVQTPEGLREVLLAQKVRYQPHGWVLMECQDLSSSYMGNLVILPFGPNNSLREVPTRPLSPRGLASDMSMAVAVLMASDLGEVA